MIEIIPYIVYEDEIDADTGNIIYTKGTIIVSHGYNHATSENIELPCVEFYHFVKEYCQQKNGLWFLKADTF